MQHLDLLINSYTYIPNEPLYEFVGTYVYFMTTLSEEWSLPHSYKK